MSRPTWTRRLLLAAVVLCTGVTLLAVSPEAPGPTQPQLGLAADTNQFDPGNIISDAVFFNHSSMSIAQIDAFLDAKGAKCAIGRDGTPCLKNVTWNTTNRSGDALCAGYQGAVGETAAVVMAKVSASCRVNPQVLLVLLQKEMGLVTSTNPTAKMYERAAGYACPDNGTGSCDPTYAGLQNQLYRSAWQYQRYAAYPRNYGYQAGRNNLIPWSPNSGCGSSTVYIKNQATAGLYNYTPYRPNTAALRAGYGTGDSCSAYGNRNFWLYFTDWFGSTQSAGGDAILASYAARGGSSGPLGPPTTGVICMSADGCGQAYANGTIYWSAATGAHVVSDPILSAWGWQRETGPLGYPSTDAICMNGGCGQVFQGGRIYHTPATGAHALSGPIQSAWMAQGWETGPLGFPASGAICINGGCGQVFQGGRIYHTPATGAHALSGPIQSAWMAQGWETGPLGYPASGAICKNGGCGQVFQGGRIYHTPATGAHALSGPIQSAWMAQGWETGPLGYPTSDQVCSLPDGACKQDFQGGTLYSHRATGTHAITTDLLAGWQASGAETGPLGYPASGTICKNGGCGQVFQGGRIYHTPATGAHALSGPIQSAWMAQGWETGPLGYPTSDQVCSLPDGACKQDFQGGTLYSHRAAGTHAITTDLLAGWQASGAETGPLGYPASGTICKNGGCGQVFQGGRIYHTPATGAHALSGPIQSTWMAQGWETGPLGYPTSGQVCINGGCGQVFQGGRIYHTPATGAHALSGPIQSAWMAQGWETGPLGFPASGAICKNGGCGQVFQGGRIYHTPATGAHALSGPIQSAWMAQGWETGPLGYPTSGVYAVSGGEAQNFQGGKLILDSATGTVRRG